MNTRVAVLVIAMTGTAGADGERTPMLGGALTFTDAGDHRAELLGGELELACWWGRVGVAVEGAARRDVADDKERNLALAGSARLLLASWMMPSLLEPRDVETGIELQAIAERTWWSRDDSADALGLGVAIRMRGGSDWEFSSLLAESRLFVRVMKSRDDAPEILARATGAMAGSPDRGGTAVLVGLGAAFGSGEPRYLQRFRPRFPRPLIDGTR